MPFELYGRGLVPIMNAIAAAGDSGGRRGFERGPASCFTMIIAFFGDFSARCCVLPGVIGSELAGWHAARDTVFLLGVALCGFGFCVTSFLPVSWRQIVTVHDLRLCVLMKRDLPNSDGHSSLPDEEIRHDESNPVAQQHRLRRLAGSRAVNLGNDAHRAWWHRRDDATSQEAQDLELRPGTGSCGIGVRSLGIETGIPAETCGTGRSSDCRCSWYQTANDTTTSPSAI